MTEKIQEAFMKKLYLTVIVIAAVALVVGSTLLVLLNQEPAQSPTPTPGPSPTPEPTPTPPPTATPTGETSPISYTYEVINVYPHDSNAFTQGLAIDEGVMYEGTGLTGES